MALAQVTSFLPRLNSPSSAHLLFAIVQCLHPTDLQSLLAAIERMEQLAFLVKFVEGRLIIRIMVDKIDRGLYYSHFQDLRMRQLDFNRAFKLAQTVPKIQITNLLSSFNSIVAYLNQVCKLQQQQIGEIQQSFFNPCLPLPKCRRSTVGKFCDSPLQILFAIKNQGTEVDYQQNYDEVSQMIMNTEEESLRSFLLLKSKKYNQKLNTILKIMSNEAIDIQLTPIQNNQLHNFVIGLLAQLKLHLSAAKQYMSLISDPFEQFVELGLRWQTYSNVLMQVDQKYGSLFKLYGEIIRDVFSCEKEFSFIQTARNMWISEMSAFNAQANTVYSDIYLALYKEGATTILPNIVSLQPSVLPYHYGLILQHYLHNPQHMQILLAGYTNYLTDISITMNDVSMCGHSQQRIQGEYIKFEQYFINRIQHTLEQPIAQVMKKGIQVEDRLLKEQVALMDSIRMKPSTVKSMLKCRITQLRQCDKPSVYFNFHHNDSQLTNLRRPHLHLKARSSLTGQTHYESDGELTEDSDEGEINMHGSKKVKIT